MNNLSEEKAIENLKIKAEYIGDNYFFSVQGIKNLKNELKIALNLIDRLQKELNNSINKDKIINKIEDLQNILDYATTEEGMAEIDEVQYKDIKLKIEVLEDLLKEIENE